MQDMKNITLLIKNYGVPLAGGTVTAGDIYSRTLDLDENGQLSTEVDDDFDVFVLMAINHPILLREARVQYRLQANNDYVLNLKVD